MHHKIIDAVAPFSVSGGTAAAFVGAKAIVETVDWVETFRSEIEWRELPASRHGGGRDRGVFEAIKSRAI